MRYFPAFFDLKTRPVFVVGGRELAVRKVRLLVKADPQIHVFSEAEQSLELGRFEAVTVHRRALAASDFAMGPALVVAADEDEERTRVAAELARSHCVPVNAVDQPELCDVVVPSMIDRGDLAIGISTGGAAPVIGRRLREQIEALLPARLGHLIEFAKTRRDAVAARVAPADRRGFWERLLSGPMAEAVLSGDERGAEDSFAAALADGVEPCGAVHIVGAGPGDPELLTLKALRVLQEADIVLYDNLVSDGVLELIRRDADRHYVGKRKGDHSMPQAEIGALMVKLAQEGKRVVRLKGGDPFIFGRGGEELEAVRQAGITVSVVPGITAAAGCAAESSVPLTHRGLAQAVTFVTAQAGGGGAPDVDWASLARLNQTIVVYMGVGRAGDVSEALVGGGMSGATPAAIIEKGTLADQRIVRTSVASLGQSIIDTGIEGPAVLVIGDVAAKADGRGLIEITQLNEVAA